MPHVFFGYIRPRWLLRRLSTGAAFHAQNALRHLVSRVHSGSRRAINPKCYLRNTYALWHRQRLFLSFFLSVIHFVMGDEAEAIQAVFNKNKNKKRRLPFAVLYAVAVRDSQIHHDYKQNLNFMHSTISEATYQFSREEWLYTNFYVSYSVLFGVFACLISLFWFLISLRPCLFPLFVQLFSSDQSHHVLLLVCS